MQKNSLAAEMHNHLVTTSIPIPPPEGSAAALARLKALAPEAHRNIPGQHTVSKALVKQFCIPGGPSTVSAINLRFSDANPTMLGYRQAGKVKNFIPYASESLEALWKKTENRIPLAIKAVEDGALFGDPEQIGLLIELVALHLVRSRQYKAIHPERCEMTRKEIRAFFLQRPAYLTMQFYREKGYYPAGREALELFIEEHFEPMKQLEAEGALARAGVERLFGRITEMLGGSSITILHPDVDAGEFLLGDSPAVTRIAGDPRVGILEGVGILLPEGRTLLPLSPGYAVELRPDGIGGHGSRMLSVSEVDDFNRVQVRAAEEWVFYRTGSGLDSFIREAAFHSQPGQKAL
jgi:hypothetical protein